MKNDDFNKTDINGEDIVGFKEFSDHELYELMMSRYQEIIGKKFDSFSIDDAMKMANFDAQVKVKRFKQFVLVDLQTKFNSWFEENKKHIFETIIQELRKEKNEMIHKLSSETKVGASIIGTLRNGYEPREKSFKKVSLGFVKDIVEVDPGLSPEECMQKFTEFVESKIKGVEVSEIKFKELWGDVYMDLTLSW